MSGLRVVLDTNVLVSGLAYPGSVPGRIVGIWRQGGLDVVLSRYILDEMVRVLPRLSRTHLSSSEIRDLAYFSSLVSRLQSLAGCERRSIFTLRARASY
jgi:predicted nucleic acid-binding protein